MSYNADIECIQSWAGFLTEIKMVPLLSESKTTWNLRITTTNAIHKSQ